MIIAAKHGFIDGERGRFSVVHRTGAEGFHTLIVSNSGRSFPESRCLENPDTFGLQLIGALVEQIGATIELERSPQTTFTIRYPAGR